MKFFSIDKKIIGILVLVLFLHVLLAYTAFGPMITSKMQNMPLGFLNKDEGVNDESMGVMLEQKLLNETGQEIKWIKYNSQQELNNAFANKEIYGGLVLPKDFTASIYSIQGEHPQSVSIEVFINQGMNSTAANVAQGIMSGIISGMNNEIINDILTNAQAMDLQFNSTQVSVLTQPLKMQLNSVNAATGQGEEQLPLIFTILLWLGSLIGSLMIWLMLHKKQQIALNFMRSQFFAGILLALVQSFWVLIVTRWFLGLNLVNYGSLIMTLIVIAFCFYLIQSSVLNWMGFKGWPLLILVWLFGPPIVSMPPEFLSSFYRWIYSWVPFRFSIESLKNIVFFDGGSNLSSMLGTLIAIGGLFLIIFIASYFRLKKEDLTISPMEKRFKSQ